MNSIEQRLLEIIATDFNFKNLPTVDLDTDLKKGIGLDSLSLTELIIACEDEFGIEIDVDDDSVNKSSNVRALYEVVERLVNEK